MRIVRLRPYLRAMERMGLDDAAMRRVEADVAAAPAAHPVMTGLRGVRKARFRLPGRGKSGGGRVIYFLAVGEAIYMMTAYPKNERDDLSAEQRKAILATIESIKGGIR
ncbi:type II toxin-antitoxin system RelE/ParE family toxin [Jiella sp. M17.18]|uniref:type II toxin-antitoxin system RelE/ParE family toxin n=1 Tax=Jiella sp. M17.18 TaxID=3234247 RepID=UPI0034E02464